ncbi:dihydrodipicolinate synthase family protein [Amylibacter sp.]|nr:dihydrodipicolinate synthase family protein [Amylibacter sp.]
MKILLPDINGIPSSYYLQGSPILNANVGTNPARVIFSAAHVVSNPFSNNDPSGSASIDWEKTISFRHHLVDMGLGIAEAMDTAQRGNGLDWPGALELIRQTKKELPNALVANGAGTDQLDLTDLGSLDDVRRAYFEQIDEIQKVGGQIILMASRALAKLAKGPEDYISIYNEILRSCDQPVILHWLGDMFDPNLIGYWGSKLFEDALETVLTIIEANSAKVDGIKVSLLDSKKEIFMRGRLPDGVKMYTGDDFNYPELIEGDAQGYSHALLGIFDPIAPAAAQAISKLGEGNIKSFRALLDPTVPLARHIFKTPTLHYKTGVVFLAWLNGFQDHFIMLNGAQAMRPLPYFVDCFKMADKCGVLRDPDMAVFRMKSLLRIYGL